MKTTQPTLAELAYQHGYDYGQKRFRVIRDNLHNLNVAPADPGLDIPPEFRKHSHAEQEWLRGQGDGYRFAMLQQETHYEEAGAILNHLDTLDAQAAEAQPAATAPEPEKAFNAPLAMGVAILGMLFGVAAAGAIVASSSSAEPAPKVPTPEMLRHQDTPEEREAGEKLRKLFNGM